MVYLWSGSPSLEDFKMLGSRLSWMAFLPMTEAWTERSMGSLPMPQFGVSAKPAQGGLLALLLNRQGFQGIQYVDLIAILQSAGDRELNQFSCYQKDPNFMHQTKQTLPLGLFQFIQRLLTAEGAT